MVLELVAQTERKTSQLSNLQSLTSELISFYVGKIRIIILFTGLSIRQN